MPEFRCRDVGAECDAHLQATDDQDLMRKVQMHLKEKHNVAQPTQTIMNYLATQVR